MKIIVASLLALIIAALAEDPMVLDNYMITKINNMAGVSWKAGENEIFKGKTLSEIKHMLGAFLPVPETDKTPRVEAQGNSLPEKFDSYVNWSMCKHDVMDQAQCGSCWAFSAASALTDRFCIAKRDGSFPILSPQDMVSCDKSNYGCQGGYLSNTWRYLENTGIVSEKCLPYKSAHGSVPACPNKCDSSSDPWKKYTVVKGSTKLFRDATAAQEDILANGPIQAGFMVYQDFFSYKSGVYHHVSGGLAGGHAVLVTGWGVENGTPYWIVKNSWGPSWGMNGYFWIKRGNNECQFESQLYAGLPNLSSA